MTWQSYAVIVLVFAAASLGVVAQSDVMPPAWKMASAATAAGCAAVLALLHPPTPKPPTGRA